MQNVPEIQRQEIVVTSVPFKPDKEMSQDQLIKMSDIMSMSASEVELSFHQDQNEISFSP